MDYNRVSENVQDIGQIYGKLESGIRSGRTNPNSGEIPKNYLPGTHFHHCYIYIAMMKLNYIRTKCTGGYKFFKIAKKINHLKYMDDTNAEK